ncbi:protein Cep89 homolog [Hylaeus anthracinus]|uniref:protein Cep89 homolog n=1 Tax=Hylaeus anthracinus TaxID=313031 RepID=UPI0023B98AC8|nr:protein Cep89 homolog [Hylaeus anthracinus]XP_054002784.1 protein Cep89 homolog [Hylaeus anthracinus]XP_054002785.1 protein Cep89 homolog [Hylaeus anthracinus]
MSVTKDNLETTYKPVYRRRRVSKARHMFKMHNACKDLPDYVTEDGNDYEGDIPLTTKSNRCRRNRRLSKESNEQQMFDEGDADSGIISSRIRDKHVSKDTLRIAKEYHKLDKCYKNVQDECRKLNSLMEEREAEYHQVCSRYETVVQMMKEMEDTRVDLVKYNRKLEAEKIQSSEDVALLKCIVYQLNAELERYQDKLKDQKLGTDFVKNNEKAEKYNQHVWGGINFHTLGPLLNAYQENLSEKQELVNMYEQEMADFGSRCKEIVAENELMHKEVENLRIECARYAQEIKSLVENSASLKKQNDILQKETIGLKKEAKEICSLYEAKMEAILKRNEALKKEHTISASELSNLKGKYEILSKEFEKVKNKEEQTVPAIVHTTAIEECRTLLEELKHQYESEKRNLCNHIKRMEENQPENEKQLVMITAERNHLKILVDKLESNLKRTQRKYENIQTLVYSTRVSRDSLKEQLNKATAYCEELFSEYERIVTEREKLLGLLRETEKENATIDRLGKTINSRVNGLKNQLENVQKGAKHQVESVEKRIKLQELRVRQMKRKYRRKIQNLKDTIKQKDDKILKLQEKHTSRNNSVPDLSKPVDDEKLQISEDKINKL